MVIFFQQTQYPQYFTDIGGKAYTSPSCIRRIPVEKFGDRTDTCIRHLLFITDKHALQERNTANAEEFKIGISISPHEPRTSRSLEVSVGPLILVTHIYGRISMTFGTERTVPFGVSNSRVTTSSAFFLSLFSRGE